MAKIGGLRSKEEMDSIARAMKARVKDWGRNLPTRRLLDADRRVNEFCKRVMGK